MKDEDKRLRKAQKVWKRTFGRAYARKVDRLLRNKDYER